MAETICKRGGLSLYLPKDTFDGIPISMCQYLNLVAIFRQNWTEVIGIIDEKQHIVELIATMELG